MSERREVLTADAVWTGVEGSRFTDAAVVIDGAHIAWLGARSDLPAEFAHLPVRHYPGATIMPGLIESHAHLTYDGGPGTKVRSFGRSAAALMAVMIGSARELLSVGVTTARDLGARDNLSLEVRDAIEEGIVRGPRLVVAGAQITTTGGHTWQNHARADSPDALRKLVRSHHKAGVDLIKINATGGFMTAGSAPGAAQFSVAEMRAVVDEAHRLGKKVAAHAHGPQGIERAVEAGVDTIEHCTFAVSFTSVVPDIDVIDAIAEAGIFVCATATWNLPQMQRKNPDFTPPVRLMYERGVRLIAGNDAGIDGVPHRNYVGGLETSVILGLPIEEVLVGATSRAAAALGLEGVAGTLEVGASADVIVIDGDPLTDISAIRNLRLVKARGEDFTPDPVAVAEPDPALSRADAPRVTSEGASER